MNKIKLIYIAGLGRSGSTLLNMIIGSDEKVISVGELKFLKNFIHEIDVLQRSKKKKNFFCECGNYLDKCSFWSEVVKEVKKDDIYYYQGNLTEKLIILNNIILPWKKTLHNEYDDKLYNAILSSGRKFKGDNVDTIVDSSKDLRRLAYLTTVDNIDLNVVFLTRDGRGVVNSNEKIGKNWITSFLSWLRGNATIDLYLRNNLPKDKVVRISYDKFSENPKKHISLLNKKLGLKINKINYLKKVNNEDYHNFAGNTMRHTKIKEIKRDTGWKKRMPKWKRTILSALTYVPNKLWVYNESLNPE